MATDGSLKVTTLTTGSNLDTSSVDYSGTTKHQQRVNISDGTASEVVAVGTSSPGTSDVGLTIRQVGQLTHGAVDGTTYPVNKLGAIGRQGRPSILSDGQRAALMSDLYGGLYVNTIPAIGGIMGVSDGTIRSLTTSAIVNQTITSGASTQLIASGGGSVYTYVLGIDTFCTSVTGTPVALQIQTGGVTMMAVPAVAGAYITLNATPQQGYLFKSAAATSITAICAAATNGVFTINLRYVSIQNGGVY